MSVALAESQISSPKLGRNETPWYDYYAGYSKAFVRDVIRWATDGRDQIRVLDPWNGSGTTTAIAASEGHQALGFDLNPALVVIAKGRSLPVASIKQSLDQLRKRIVSAATKPADQVLTDEPLEAWFNPKSARRIRRLERAVHEELVADRSSLELREPMDPNTLSALGAFFYCALFVVVRQLSSSFRTSNPTWVRTARQPRERIDVSRQAIDDRFSAAITALAERLDIKDDPESPLADLRLGAAECVSLKRKADLVLTSPPYCTRIDYVVATRPELAVLGHGEQELTELRRKMLGTPLTRGVSEKGDEAWGVSANEVLKSVSAHKSKAADTYYRRYYANYFRNLWTSLCAIDSSTKKSGAIAVVVQDSYFKDVHVDLPTIVEEMGSKLDRPSARIDFAVPRTKASIHPGAHKWRKSFQASEALVVLQGN